MRVGTNENRDWAKVGSRKKSLNRAEAHDNSILAFRAGGKRLNAESGDQRVERQDGLVTSHISELGRTRSVLDWKSKDIDRNRRNQGFKSEIGAVLHQP